MDKKLEEQVIYPKDLLFAALYRWKVAVVLGVVLALLLGGLQLLKAPKTGTVDPGAQAAYEAALEEYEAKRTVLLDYEEKYRSEVETQTQYMQDSVLLSLDPDGHYRGVVQLYISTDYEIQPDKAYQTPDKTPQLLANYQAMLHSDSAVTALAQTAELEWRLMNELYTVEIDREAGVLSARFRHHDEDVLKLLLAKVLEMTEQLQPGLVQSIGQHTLFVIFQDVALVADPTVVNAIGENRSHLEYLNGELNKVQAELAGLAAPVQPQAAAFSPKKAVIFAVLGFVAGFVLVAVWAWFAHMESDKVYSARLLRLRTGIKVLGTLRVTKFDAVTRTIRKWEGRDAADPAEKAALLACDIRNRFPEGKLLLTGSGKEKDRTMLLEALRAAGADVVDAGNILKDAPAVDALKQAAGVLLAEKCAQSTCTDIFNQMQSVGDYNKTLIGCIVLDG